MVLGSTSLLLQVPKFKSSTAVPVQSVSSLTTVVLLTKLLKMVHAKKIINRRIVLKTSSSKVMYAWNIAIRNARHAIKRRQIAANVQIITWWTQIMNASFKVRFFRWQLHRDQHSALSEKEDSRASSWLSETYGSINSMSKSTMDPQRKFSKSSP